MEEFLETVNKTIQNWAQLKGRRRFSISRERALIQLIRNLEKYTLLQLDILTTLRGMTKAVKYELKTIRNNK